MNEKYYQRTLALAGILQAANQVQQIAQTGQVDATAFEVSIKSIYKIDANDVPEIYTGIRGLRVGLLELIKIFNMNNFNGNKEISYYLLSILNLERKLHRDNTVNEILSRRVKHAIAQAEYFSPLHPQVIASLAAIYTDTLGSFNFRIKVIGKAAFLTRTEIADKVRALLLAGIRSAVLWRQVGGSRLQLFTARKTMTKIAQELLNTMA